LKRLPPLAVILPIQALLLFWNLNLLPGWTDEMFTLHVAARPVAGILASVARDIHPPLYFLMVHLWVKLPLPWEGIDALRAFSALWALAATVLLDRLWVRSWKPRRRWPALALFALSPCLLLYGRMARSYSMQAALAILVVALLARWLRQPESSLRRAVPAFLALLALLYTHYVPGLALLAGFCVVAWHPLGFRRVATFAAATVAGYGAWLPTLAHAAGRWSTATEFSSHYYLTGNPATEQALKAGFGVVSLSIGESFATLSLALVPVVVVLAGWGVWSLAARSRVVIFVLVSGAIGYFAVAWWVSYPFIPARLLWLLPFYCLAITIGITRSRAPVRYAAVAALFVSYVSSAGLYFRRENFANPGYTAPLREIAGRLNREAAPEDLILADTYNTDSGALRAHLSRRTPLVTVTPWNAAAIRARLASAGTVWVVRNPRDISPHGISTAIESEACAVRCRETTYYEPLAAWQIAALRMAGVRRPPAHFYQLTVCRPAKP
jgi:hypothetical protein